MIRKKNTYSAPALEKGLDIIELLSRSFLGLSQAEIAKELIDNSGMPILSAVEFQEAADQVKAALS